MDDALLSWCKRLIQCRSVTNEGTRTIAELCARELLAPNGIEARLLPSSQEGLGQVNLFALIKGHDPAASPIVLNTHLDTVPPGDPAAWTECANNPFAATLRDDRIYGLGAADTKLDFAAKVFALARGGTPRRDTYLVGTFGEEHGLVGAKEMAQTGLLPRDALAFVGEPSRLEVITAHKGLMVFELTATFTPGRSSEAGDAQRVVFAGRAAHSSTPALGRNAIRIALDALAANPGVEVFAIDGGDAVNKVPARCEVIVAAANPPLANSGRVEPARMERVETIPPSALAAFARFVNALSDFADRAGPPEADYAAPTVTCNPGVIRSAPGSIKLEFELRPPPGLALDVVRRGVSGVVDAIAPTIPGIMLSLVERRANPGFRSALASETVELAMAAQASAGLPLTTNVKAGCTEAGIYAAAGMWPVVFGPGPSTGVIHAPNEYNLIGDVDGALRFYLELLKA
jgi:acetylornithine deacetylase/succinyl-diaminopimelate desuccinylase-like protein